MLVVSQVIGLHGVQIANGPTPVEVTCTDVSKLSLPNEIRFKITANGKTNPVCRKLAKMDMVISVQLNKK